MASCDFTADRYAFSFQFFSQHSFFCLIPSGWIVTLVRWTRFQLFFSIVSVISDARRSAFFFPLLKWMSLGWTFMPLVWIFIRFSRKRWWVQPGVWEKDLSLRIVYLLIFSFYQNWQPFFVWDPEEELGFRPLDICSTWMSCFRVWRSFFGSDVNVFQSWKIPKHLFSAYLNHNVMQPYTNTEIFLYGNGRMRKGKKERGWDVKILSYAYWMTVVSCCSDMTFAMSGALAWQVK